jgi:hypothetical protein
MGGRMSGVRIIGTNGMRQNVIKRQDGENQNGQKKPGLATKPIPDRVASNNNGNALHVNKDSRVLYCQRCCTKM